ncbi:urease, beta subunit [Thermodesulfatator indicus DSM 15286]|uniref:Urease subunit beta n=1 Tax=Thermodesulfatator indicus (strain DSM 15286 / JCM 11887 / CIR29812) TaxID=667014 RepID=F8A815_THEID|nr:urease subunit beta [Thermodesulfatator indicus]AEH45008.1 urease, beta subunit [Thermodesulfatator indicus DSM 15286]
MKPGELFLSDEEIILNQGKTITKIKVINNGDRPIQVGSHFHFFEANKYLKFDRKLAYGKRLNIPAGGAVRFEVGEEKEVELIDISGKRYIRGFNGLVNGFLDDLTVKENAFNKAKKLGFMEE